MQNPFITHSDLVERGAKWLESQHAGYYGKEKTPARYWNHAACGVILKEYKCITDSIPDVIGFTARRSVVIECKVSRADFLADQKKPHRAVDNLQQCGNYRYYLTLPNIVGVEDVPEGWGLLYAQSNKIQVVKPSPEHIEPQIRVAEYFILYSIARRCALRGVLKDIQDYGTLNAEK
jgi:hypothetical protein